MEDFNLVLKRKLFVLASALFIAGGILSSDAKTLLLVPQDNRSRKLNLIQFQQQQRQAIRSLRLRTHICPGKIIRKPRSYLAMGRSGT